jgi:predicted transcriptional regulator
MKKNEQEKMLTEVELELMTILWTISEGSVSDVISHLAPGRDLAYTSVSTILRILEQKAILKTRKEGRGHVYIPVLDKETYERKAVKHVVEKVFHGTPSSLVKHLIESGDLDLESLNEIKALISKSEKRK